MATEPTSPFFWGHPVLSSNLHGQTRDTCEQLCCWPTAGQAGGEISDRDWAWQFVTLISMSAGGVMVACHAPPGHHIYDILGKLSSLLSCLISNDQLSFIQPTKNWGICTMLLIRIVNYINYIGYNFSANLYKPVVLLIKSHHHMEVNTYCL